MPSGAGYGSINTGGPVPPVALPGVIRRKGAAPKNPKPTDTAGNFETLDYDKIPNSILRDEIEAKSASVRSLENVSRWVVTLLVGVTTGAVAFGIDRAVRTLAEFKFSLGLHRLRSEDVLGGFFSFLGVSVGFVVLSSLFVAFGEPLAGGSGIPEVKAYLNGTKLRRLLRVRTLICKVVGVIFSVAGGLAVGKEGPLVHAGSILAAHLSQGGKMFRYERPWLRGMRNDHDKRDFISGGAAAGVSAAFGAPIGGVLFSLEEASSFWSLRLTWRTFFCSMVCSFTLNFFLSGSSGDMSKPGLITFGSVQLRGFEMWNLIPFLLIAVSGGLLGALFNWVNIVICRWRRAVVNQRPLTRVLEAALIAAFSASCLFLVPYWFDGCVPLSARAPGDDNASHYPRYNCPEGQFSSAAALFYAPQDDAIAALFHNGRDFPPLVLGVFSMLYFLMAVVTYGSSVPSGLFVPSILIGASFGRLVGHVVDATVPSDWNVTPASFALVGAASMLGGVCRMTISLTVILAETTNDNAFLFPIMLSLTISKWVGDRFNESLYDLHVKLKGIPFLEPEPAEVMDHLVATDIATKRVRTLDEVVTVEEVVRLLRSCKHNGFPILSRCRAGNGRTFSGLILRSQLCFLLQRKEFVPEDVRKRQFTPARGGSGKNATAADYDMGHGQVGAATGDHSYDHGGEHGDVSVISDTHWTSSNLKWIDFSTSFASLVPDVDDVVIDPSDMPRLVDLKPYMHTCPYTVTGSAPVSRCFTLFRTMGLRHLCVVDSHHELLGIITRHELTEDAVEKAHAQLVGRKAVSNAGKRKPVDKATQRLLDGSGAEDDAHSFHFHGGWSAVAEFQRVDERDIEMFGAPRR